MSSSSTSSSASASSQWHPKNILLPFSLSSLAHPNQCSTSREHVKRWTRGIFDPISTLETNGNISDFDHDVDQGDNTPTIWECQTEFEKLVRLRLAIHAQLIACRIEEKRADVDLDVLYQHLAEYHASLKACEKYQLGLYWDSGGWIIPDDNTIDTEEATLDTNTNSNEEVDTRTTISKERQFVLYNLGCLTVLRYINETAKLAISSENKNAEEDWTKQRKVFGTAITYFFHAKLSPNKLKICQAMLQRALYEAAYNKTSQHHLLLSKLAMATHEFYSWNSDYFKIIAFYHDGKRLKKKKEHSAAYARFQECSNFFRTTMQQDIDENLSRLRDDVEQEILICQGNEDIDTTISSDSLPSICGQFCRQKIHEPLPAYSTKSPQIFFANLLPSQIRGYHYCVKNAFQLWIEGWYFNQIQDMTETALRFIQNMESVSHGQALSHNLLEDEYCDFESESQYHNELLVLMDQWQQCGEEVDLLNNELQKEKERFNSPNIQTFVPQDGDLFRQIKELESKVAEKKGYLEKARMGDQVILDLLQNSDKGDQENRLRRQKTSSKVCQKLSDLVRERQNIIFPALIKQVLEMTLIPKFQELYSKEKEANPMYPRDGNQNKDGGDNSWLLPYQEIAEDFKDYMIGTHQNTTTIDGNEVNWAQKLRENLELQPILIQKIIEQDSDRSSEIVHSSEREKRQQNIPQQLAHGREFYQNFTEQLKQLRIDISEMSTNITVLEIEYKEQVVNVANRERQEKEDEEIARIFAEEQQADGRLDSNHADVSLTSSRSNDDIAAILTVIENENRMGPSSSHSRRDDLGNDNVPSQYPPASATSGGPPNSHFSLHDTDDSNYHVEQPVPTMPAVTRAVSRSSHGSLPIPPSTPARRPSLQLPSTNSDTLTTPLQIRSSFRRHTLTGSSSELSDFSQDDFMESTRSLTLENEVENTTEHISSTGPGTAASTANHDDQIIFSNRSGYNPNSRPGIVQVNYYELPATHVHDEKVASLVAMDFDVDEAFAALLKHDNNMELALNELLHGGE